ncbi:unnamed protein product [Mucor circinelloides]|uniref:Late embryogenesis abundant protein LEA-2 subgroup domain-containing protein n=1 Tax=Mucor circinelloides f. circinelloides (strain 1006PhL) TaxID=1220926 RepID=S2JXZ5_MUCC1|nr:hypothetical protein HMPREF1544_05546 [Mucor circinelloides 1006PhL]KAG1119237.1 hypothetical protein G6F42_013019 [Rhizopus arrhizus]
MSAPPYHQHDDFYDRPAPPPLPHHIETNRDSTDRYPMNDIPVNSPSPYPVYNQQNNSSLTAVPSPPAHRYSDQSDMKFMDHYDSDDDLEKIIPREKKKRTCMDKLCCGCCTCCPKWARWCSCIFLIIIIIIAIVVGVLAALFKVPNVQFTGLKQDPVYAYANNVLSMTFDVGISVDNQNLESITFETIKADAYYPAPYNVFIGGGNITDTHIASYAMTNITFPFSVKVNSSDPGQQGVLMDLVTRCGLDGSAPQKINFDYYIYPTVRIAGIAITPKISKSMSLACPTSELNQLLGGLFTK